MLRLMVHLNMLLVLLGVVAMMFLGIALTWLGHGLGWFFSLGFMGFLLVTSMLRDDET